MYGLSYSFLNIVDSFFMFNHDTKEMIDVNQ